MTGQRKTFLALCVATCIPFLVGLYFTGQVYKDFFMQNVLSMDDFAMGQYYFNHGDTADGTYDLKKAQYYFEQARDTDPTANILTWHQLGRIDFLNGDFVGAIYNFKKQIEYFGTELPNVHYMLALTYAYQARSINSSITWHKAEEHFITYLQYDPLSPWARVDLAWVYFAQGKFDAMKELLEVGLTYEPDNAWLLNMYGLALLNTGEQDAARAYFLWAKAAADRLTVSDWGKSYPGNDPGQWERGLNEFRQAIANNLALVSN